MYVRTFVITFIVMASVHRQRNSRGKISPYWQMVYTDETGRRVMRSTKQTDRRLAQKVANETEHIANLARQGELTQSAVLKNWGQLLERTTGENLRVVSVEDYFKEHLENRRKSGTKESTLKKYRLIYKRFIESLTPQKRKASIGSINPLDIAKFRDSEIATGKKASTVNKFVDVISLVLGDAKRKQLSLHNPCENVDKLKDDREEKEPFTRDQVKLLLSVASNEWRGMILIGFHAGLRLTDASNLEWQNIDLASNQLTFVQKKINRKTVVALHPDVMTWVESQETGVGKAPLFPSLYGRISAGSRGLSTEFEQLLQQVGIVVPTGRKAQGKGRTMRKLSFHSFRHTMISNLANAEVSADVRKAIAGHSSDEIHNRYTHLETSTQHTAIRRIPSVL